MKNTEPLNYKQRHNYILEVVAEDCGGLASKKAFVNILITEKCQPGWEGENIDDDDDDDDDGGGGGGGDDDDDDDDSIDQVYREW